ncbi:hypothetical protein [Brevibacillus dissolubilis]|uniref:hypothetical protein n=1 Tax=Brevibacillus dissolubilis TaxID=1844116 RepID=UPI001115F61B|nr:hypothetical protein [Brevibacillus dissolubilis]
MTAQLYPTLTPDPTRHSPTAETMGELLDRAAFLDLYETAIVEGIPYFARINGTGDVELYLVFESVDAFSEATDESVSVEFKTYQNKLLAVIWTLSDPENPLGFPLTFDVHNERERYMAYRLVEQAETAIYYLAPEQERLLHIFSETVTFSGNEREQVRGMIGFLFNRSAGQTESAHESAETDQAAGNSINHSASTPVTDPKAIHPASNQADYDADAVQSEIKEEPIVSVDAMTLSDTILQDSGVAYQFAYDRLIAEHGEEGAQHLLMSTVHQALLVMRRHNRSEVRETACTVWVGEREQILSIYITPGLFDLFEVVHTSEDEANPFSRFLLAIPEFIQTQEGAPLAEGAYPIFRFDQGRLSHLELDEAFQARLAERFAKDYPSMSNPYAL